MRVELREGVWSDEVPHTKVKISKNEVYYFAKMPLGDYSIHTLDVDRGPFGSGGGYFDRRVDFLMDNGKIEHVYGPWHRDGRLDYGQHRILAERLGRPEIAVEATKIKIETGFWDKDGKQAVVFEEKDWVLGDWRKRLRKEWEDCYLRLTTVFGSRLDSVCYYV